MTAATRVTRGDWRLLVGPVLLLAGLALLKLSDVLVDIGPFDRAEFGWAVPVPMLLLAPGAIGVAARRSGAATARRTADLTGALFGIVLGVAWFASVTQIGCDPNPGLPARLFASMPIPLVLGVGWAIAGRAAAAHASRPIVAVVVGAGVALLTGVIMLATWAILFPGVTCAYVPPPA